MKAMYSKSGAAIKTLFVFLLLFSACFPAFAQEGNGINYQAALKDADGHVLDNQAVSLRITLLKGTSALYTETHQTVTSADGIVSVLIGKGTVETGDFSAIDWTGERIKAKIELDENGGSNYTVLGTTPLASVPYAYYAERANIKLKGHGVLIDGYSITAKDSSTTNEIQELVLEGNVLKLTKANQVTLPGGSQQTVLTLTQAEFNALAKYKGLQVLNTTDNCLYIYTSDVFYRKLCGFSCFPVVDAAVAGPDIAVNETAVQLTGNVPSTGSGSWSIVSGTGGAITNANGNTATFTGISAHNYVVRYTITNECGSSSDDKQILLEIPTISDFEGNTYPVATIGSQTWMLTQLKSTKYADGTDITGFLYPNNDPLNKDVYGLLYNPNAALKNVIAAGTQGACPNGYHVPTENELLTLFTTLNNTPNTGFVPIRAGQKNTGFGVYNMLMSSTPLLSGNGMIFYSFNTPEGGNTFFFTSTLTDSYLSVRCVKN